MHNSPTNEQCLSVLPIGGQDRQTPKKLPHYWIWQKQSYKSIKM